MGTVCARNRHKFKLGIMLAWMLLAWCPPVFALNPALDISQYAHIAWTYRDGPLQGAVYAIAQTPDGYLWLATQSGVVRFETDLLMSDGPARARVARETLDFAQALAG